MVWHIKSFRCTNYANIYITYLVQTKGRNNFVKIVCAEFKHMASANLKHPMGNSKLLEPILSKLLSYLCCLYSGPADISLPPLPSTCKVLQALAEYASKASGLMQDKTLEALNYMQLSMKVGFLLLRNNPYNLLHLFLISGHSCVMTNLLNTCHHCIDGIHGNSWVECLCNSVIEERTMVGFVWEISYNSFCLRQPYPLQMSELP